MSWRTSAGRGGNRFSGGSGGSRGRHGDSSTNFTSLLYLASLRLRSSDGVLNVLSKNKDKYSQDFISIVGNKELLKAITKVNAKICESTFIADKYKVLKITVCKRFIDAWKTQITLMYSNQEVEDVLTIFQNALDLMPSLCWYQIRIFLNYLISNKISFSIPSSVMEKLYVLKEKVDYFENRFSKANKRNSALDPTDDFHTINVIPTTKELVTRERNFVRTNKIDGAYDSVSQYLDVLFRLQREDFVNPIREDLCDYINEVDRPRFNIKIFDKVAFFGETCNRDDICYTLQIELTKKIAEQLKSNGQKKFMTGSLLLFTDDNFNTILKGLVVNSDAASRGELVVSFEESFPRLKHFYKMVECTVFFDPYYQVLKVLQTIETNELPMGKYIINVETSVKRPAYLPITIPKPQVNLNKSQEKAYNAAFTQEFVVIQGPPGTGKTFLGLTITRQILKHSQGPILIVCYTNHALDQFLEGLLPSTTKLVRLGSQSKNKILQEQTLRRMRREMRLTPMVTGERSIIEKSAIKIKTIDRFIKILREPEGIVDLKYMIAVPQDSFTEEYLFIWLLQDTTKYADGDEEAGYLRDIYWNYMKAIKSKTNYLVSPVEMRSWLNFISTSISDLKLEICSVNAAFIEGQMSEEEYQYYLTFYESETKLFQEDCEFITEKLEFLEKQLNKKHDLPITRQLDDPSILSTNKRWQLYQLWLEESEQLFQVEKRKQLAQYRAAYAEFSILMEDADVATLRKMDIIGMTTSCAARMHSTLQRVACPIVVVEEAAEVVEAHIVTALTKECQHLILLGDHQQLKPSTSDYVLERQYNLGISLFERMVRNNIQCHTLNVQHRMRPEFASLITPVIYPVLKNSFSVYEYPEIRGVQKSLFFISHKHREEPFGDSSKLNKFEAQYLVRLAEYLLKVGYAPEEITILAAYAGQLVILNKEVAKNKYEDLGKVNVTTIDNYQGEENKIILLSLVRNNDEGNVGFLKIENRICVALSRAKEGFFIMGNLKMLCNASDIWKEIKQTLKSLEAKGSSLPLLCENHGTVTIIKKLEDFEKVPEGGCDKDCNAVLKCGHTCPRKCHILDVSHERYKCMELCLKKICENSSHDVCKKFCYEKCGPCKHPVKVTPDCGHEQKVPCCDTKDLSKVKCVFEETVDLPCGHDFTKICHEKSSTKPCEKLCSKLLKCGHKCLQKCHYGKDAEHIEYKCEKKCKKYYLDCKKFGKKHFALFPCHQTPTLCNQKSSKLRKECSHHYKDIPCHKDVDKMICTKPCKKNLPCCHPCRNECSSICGPCKVEAPQQAACGHWLNRICGSEPRTTNCTKQCDKNLPCGHKCPNKCNQRCAPKCRSTCSKQLDCGHACIARCGEPCVCQIKQIPECLHRVMMKCSDEPTKENCEQCTGRIRAINRSVDDLRFEDLCISDDDDYIFD